MVPLEGVAAELLLVIRSAATIIAIRQEAIRTPRDIEKGLATLTRLDCADLRLSTDFRALIFMIDSQAAATEAKARPRRTSLAK
jgi:hypothetical protein